MNFEEIIKYYLHGKKLKWLSINDVTYQMTMTLGQIFRALMEMSNCHFKTHHWNPKTMSCHLRMNLLMTKIVPIVIFFLKFTVEQRNYLIVDENIGVKAPQEVDVIELWQRNSTIVNDVRQICRQIFDVPWIGKPVVVAPATKFVISKSFLFI